MIKWEKKSREKGSEIRAIELSGSQKKSLWSRMAQGPLPFLCFGDGATHIPGGWSPAFLPLSFQELTPAPQGKTPLYFPCNVIILKNQLLSDTVFGKAGPCHRTVG